MSNPAVSSAEAEEPAKGAPSGSGVFAGLSFLTGLGAAVASSCCALPLALATAGVSGAWLGNFTELVFYKDYILTAAAVALVVGWIVIFIHRAKICAVDGACTRRRASWLTFAALGLSTVLVGFAAASDWLEPLIVRYLISLNGSA